MQTNAANAANAERQTPAQFDTSKLGSGRKVELEGDLICEFVPDKPGFEAGITHTGIFVLSKKVVSQKLTTGKKDENGNRYRMLHVLKDAAGNNYGIWGTGVLDALLKSVSAGKVIAVTYTGRATKALQPGQQPPMEFNVVEF